MSVTDAQAIDLLSLIRGHGDVDQKINEFAAVKAQVKHNAVQGEAIAPLFEACRIGVQSPNNTLSAHALSCLGHLIKRVTIQERARMRSQANPTLPVLIEKFADPKERNRLVANKAVVEFYNTCPAEVEKYIKELGFGSKNPRIRQESINWLATIHSEQQGFSFRGFTPYLMQMLEDANEPVRETAKGVAVQLFHDAPDHAKSDLKRELTKRGVRKGIATYIISQLGLPGGDANGNVANHGDDMASSRQGKGVSGGGSGGSTFLNTIPGVEMEQMDPAYVNTNRELEDMLQDMLPHFEGRESEHNWKQREKDVQRLRQLVRGNAYKDYQATFQAGIKTLLDGILNVVNSLRTTLSSTGCQLVKDLAIVMGPGLDPMLEIILTNFIKLCAGTKKITSQLGNLVVAVIVANVSYHVKLLNHIYNASTDKNVSPRSYAPGWIQIVLEVHGSHKAQIEHTGGLDLLEKAIRKGLADSNPGVREASRVTYWKFARVWPEKANVILESLDGSHRKLLEKANPDGTITMAGPAAARGAPSRTATAPARPSIRDAILAQKRSQGNLKAPAEAPLMTARDPSPAVSGPTGLSSAPVRRPGLKTRPATEKPLADQVSGFVRAGSPALTQPSGRATPHAGRTARSPPPSPPLSRFARGTTPSRSQAQSSIRKPTIAEQLNSPDWKVRVEGIITVACILARRTPPGYEGQKMPSLPPSDVFAPMLAKLLNDQQPEVVEHVVAPEVLAELAKVVPLDQIVPKVLLLAGGADEQHAQPITTSTIPALKRLMTESEAAELLLRIITSMSTTGVVPRKLALGSFTQSQKRTIIQGAAAWMNEIVESHARGTPNNFFHSDANYNSVVNRLIPLVKTGAPNTPIIATLLKNLETLDPREFAKITSTLESGIVRELHKAWGQQEGGPPVVEEKVADVEEILGAVPDVTGQYPRSTTPQAFDLNNQEVFSVLPALPTSPPAVPDILTGSVSRKPEEKPTIRVYQDPVDTTWNNAPTTNGTDQENQRPRTLKKHASANNLPKTPEATSHLLHSLVDRLHARDMDTQAFRKLTNVIRNNVARGVLKESNNDESSDIWQNGSVFEELITELLAYLTAEDVVSDRAGELRVQGLLVLKQLLLKCALYFARHEKVVLETILEVRGRWPNHVHINSAIEEIAQEFIPIANPQEAIDGILDVMERKDKPNKATWCLALSCLAPLVRDSKLGNLEPQLHRLGEFAVKSMNAEEEAEVRRSCVPVCIELNSKLKDPERLFDDILGGMKVGHQNLLAYYFRKRDMENERL